MDQQQSNTIRCAKGIAILLVVLGHASGILFELNLQRYKKDPLRFIGSKARLLLVPYFVLSFIIYLTLFIGSLIPQVQKLMETYFHSPGSVQNILFEIFTYEGHAAQHLWFVLVLFLIFAVNILFRNVNRIVFAVICILLSVFGLHILKMYFHVPDIIDYFIFEIPFFAVGRLIVSNKKLFGKAVSFNLSPVLFAGMAAVYFILTDNYSGSFDGPVRWIYLFIMRVTGIASLFSVSAVLQKSQKCLKVLCFFEKRSYPIYLLHQPFIVSGLAGLMVHFDIPVFVIIPAVTAAGIGVPLAVNHFLENSRLYNLLILGGRKINKTA